MGILDGIVEWIAEQIMAGLDLVTTSVLGASLSIFSLTHGDLRLKGRNAPIIFPICDNYLPCLFSPAFKSGKNCSRCV